MSTFFQKLTGSATDGGDEGTSLHNEEAPPQKQSQQPQARRAPRQAGAAAQDKKSTRIRVESETFPSQAREVPPEDEGELTVDIFDAGDSIIIQSTVAGVKPEDLDVTITTDTVTIRGSRNRQEETGENDYYYKELFWGTFSRSVILPEEIDEDAAEATLKYGLLSIRLPKKRKNVAQKLKVKAV